MESINGIIIKSININEEERCWQKKIYNKGKKLDRILWSVIALDFVDSEPKKGEISGPVGDN